MQTSVDLVAPTLHRFDQQALSGTSWSVQPSTSGRQLEAFLGLLDARVLCPPLVGSQCAFRALAVALAAAPLSVQSGLSFSWNRHAGTEQLSALVSALPDAFGPSLRQGARLDIAGLPTKSIDAVADCLRACACEALYASGSACMADMQDVAGGGAVRIEVATLESNPPPGMRLLVARPSITRPRPLRDAQTLAAGGPRAA